MHKGVKRCVYRKVILCIGVLILSVVVLISCSQKSTRPENGLCNSGPFASVGVEVSLPLIPVSFHFETDGVNLAVDGNYALDFYFFEVKPYLIHESEGNPVSPCLRVIIIDPEWEENKEFYVNFNSENTFIVRVWTDQITEFEFSKDKWNARSPGNDNFISYEYSTNTLTIDATNNKISEVVITPEIQGEYQHTFFCTSFLKSNSNGFLKNPLHLVFAVFQDIVNTTREKLFDGFGRDAGSIFIFSIGVFGLILLIKRTLRNSNNRRLIVPILYSAAILIWIIFWVSVYVLPSTCIFN